MQQINLLLAFPKAVRQILDAQQAIAICGAFILSMMLLVAYYQWQYSSAETQLNLLRKEAIASANKMESLALQYPAIADKEPLESKVLMLAEEVKHKSHLYDRYIRSAKNEAFSEYMLSLSKIVPEGVWLRLIHIDQENDLIIFSGSSVDPVLIPNFIKDLSKSKYFLGKKFSTLYLHESEHGKGLIDFTIGAPNNGRGANVPAQEYRKLV